MLRQMALFCPFYGLVVPHLLNPLIFRWTYMCMCLFCFLGPHLQHTEVPRLGVKLELQLLAYATATWDPSHIYDLHHSHSNARSLTHWARPWIEPSSSWILVGFINSLATKGTLPPKYLIKIQIIVHYVWAGVWVSGFLFFSQMIIMLFVLRIHFE